MGRSAVEEMVLRAVVYEQARLWHNTLGLQEDRIFGAARLPDPTADVWFALIAFKNSLQTAKMAEGVDLVDLPAIALALQRFGEAKSCRHVRDVFEHVEDYMAGTGRLQETGDVQGGQYLPTILSHGRDRLEVQAGRYSVWLPDAFAAARELLQSVRLALPDGSAGRFPEPEWY